MVHGASLCLDNVVEIFSGAVVSIAESHAQVENTTMGLQLIEKMTEKGLIDGSEVIEVRKTPYTDYPHVGHLLRLLAVEFSDV